MLPVGASVGCPDAREGKSWSACRLDPNYTGPSGKVGRYTRDQPSSANRHDYSVHLLVLLGQFESNTSLPQECLTLIKGVDVQSTGAGLPAFGGGGGVRVTVSSNYETRPKFANAVQFRGRAHGRNEESWQGMPSLRAA